MIHRCGFFAETHSEHRAEECPGVLQTAAGAIETPASAGAQASGLGPQRNVARRARHLIGNWKYGAHGESAQVATLRRDAGR
jgi:hypothetical protein